MVTVSAADRRLRAIVALVVMAGVGLAQAARTPDVSDAGGSTASMPIDTRSQTSN
ncbi:hypothetical protein J2R87_001797 [Bradyrhizobium elkanii]|nr:hypothetical protein [Bradyrhizobium elkanii]MCS4110441.1 hypothetical protein [Bradyrhizobium elkanii]